MNLNTLDDLLHDQLKDLFSAESQLVKALPKMAKAVSSDDLRTAFEEHLAQTKTHVERLEAIGKQLGVKLTGKKCAAMEGLVEEGSEALELEGEDSLIDAAIIAAAQRVEHYEIAAYGTVRTMAEQLGLDDVVALLQETLEEEEGADDRLTEIAENEIYPMIANLGDSADQDDEPESPKKKQVGKSR